MWGMTDLTKENLSLSFPPIGANFPTPSFLTLRIALILNSHSLSHSSSLTHILSFFLALSPPSCSHMYEYEQKHSPRASNLLTHTLPSSLLARFFSFFLIHTFSHSRSLLLSLTRSHPHPQTHTLSLPDTHTLSYSLRHTRTHCACCANHRCQRTTSFLFSSGATVVFSSRLHRDRSERTLHP